MSVLHIRHLSHRYGITEALTNVNLDLHASETLALVGPSGCGKSTLLHLVSGLLTPSEGIIHSEFRGPACVFQEPRLMPWKTGLDNIALGLKALGVAGTARRKRAADLGQRMGLSLRDMDKYPHALSGGMQSRVSLARALVINPDLLLLDEPFTALDIGLKEALYAALDLQIAQQGTAVLLITHDLIEAVRLADRIVMMVPKPGRILYEFPLMHPHHQRDSAWVYHTMAKLMQVDAIRIGFGLSDDTLSPFNSHQPIQGCSV
ncbi:ABC transporter ATP-binding protein [Nitrincola sp.]|uniref:ABC transporter ATP-binding protein n=1 Tax=Nitrincola sp. TaxID=1926584 RepID=UPI003A8FE7E7